MTWSQELNLKENASLIVSVFSLSSPDLHEFADTFYITFKKSMFLANGILRYFSILL